MAWVELIELSTGMVRAKTDGTIFNLTKVDDSSQQTRLIAALDLLYIQAREVGGAPMEVVSGIRSRRNREIRLFNRQSDAVSGTPSKPVTYIEPGGTAGWKWAKGSGAGSRFNDPSIPVSERDDERIYCKPQASVLNFGPYVAIIWHELTHTMTMLRHGTWGPSGGFEQPALPENVAWHAFMQKLKAGAPHMAKDPLTGELDFITVETQEWVCNCGMLNAG